MKLSVSRKKLSWLLPLVLLTVGVAAYVVAAPPPPPPPPGGPAALSPEEVGKIFDLKEKFRTDTAALRKQLIVKRAELRDLWKADKPDEKAIVAKMKEINPLQEQLQEKRVALRLQLPKGPFGHHGPGMGMHPGMHKGMGMGMGGPGMACGMGPGMACGMGQGPGWGKGGAMGHGMMHRRFMMMAKLTPQQAGQVFELRQQFMNDTAAQRKQLWVKKAEMRALWRAEKPDEKAIVGKVKEIAPIKEQLAEKRISLRLKVREFMPVKGAGKAGEAKTSMSCPLMGEGQGMEMASAEGSYPMDLE